MNKYNNVRALALRLREEGKSLNEMQQAFPMVPKTTLYGWVREIKRPPQHRKANVRAAVAANAKRWGAVHAEWKRAADEALPGLLSVETFRAFLAVYACEGSRKERGTVSVVNTDPAVIRLSQSAMHLIAKSKALRYELRLYADQKPEVELGYWATALGIESCQIVVRQKASHGLSKEKSPCSHGIMRVGLLSTAAKMLVDEGMLRIRTEWLNL